MSDDAESFAHEIPEIRSAESITGGEYIHVYRGELEQPDGGEVRILSLAPEITNPDVRDAFNRKAVRWQHPSTHPNIVTVYERGASPRPWLAVADIGTQKFNQVRTELSMTEIGAVIADTADALQNATLYNTVHSALSPGDIWIGESESGVSALVDGWGLERSCRVAAGENPLTLFSAPELAESPDDQTEQTDVYGLGAVAYYGLTGQPPLTSNEDIAGELRSGDVTPPSILNSELTEAVDEVLLRALSHDPEERHQSCREFKTAFTGSFPTESDIESAEPVTLGREQMSDRDDGVYSESGGDTPDSTSDRILPDQGDSPNKETTTGKADDDDTSFLSRRTILAGVGLAGIGGVGFLAVRSGSDEAGDADDSSPDRASDADGTPGASPTATAVETPIQTETPAAPAPETETPTQTPEEESPTPESTPTPQPGVEDAMYHQGPRNHGVVESPRSSPPSRELAETWRFDADNSIRTAPAVAGETVYFGTDGGTLYAVDTADGSERWSVGMGDTVRSSPAVVGGTVYVGSDADTLFALDAETGSEQWTFDTLDSIRTAPNVVDGTVYVGCDDRNVYAVDAADGSQLWTHRVRGQVRCSPAVTSDHVYVGRENNILYKLDRTDGSKIWTFETEQSVRAAPVVGDGTVYFGTTDGDANTAGGSLYALDERLGETEWVFDEPNDIADSPVLADGAVYAVDLNDRVWSVDAESGTENWSFNTFSSLYAAPLYVSGYLYVPRSDNTMSVFSDAGSQQATFSAGRAFRSAPTLSDGTLYVGCDDRNLYALGDPSDS